MNQSPKSIPHRTRAIDKCKYKVVHIATNATTWHSSKANAFRRASAIDGLVAVRRSTHASNAGGGL